MPVLVPPAFGIGGDPALTLAPVAARASGGAGSPVVVQRAFRWITFELLVSGVSGSSATLDVWVQQALDGVNWDDVLHFAQVTDAAGPQVQSAYVPVGPPEATGAMHTWAAGGLAGGTICDLVLGRRFRAQWTIGGTTPSFTFGVAAYPRDV